jgi:hypothetical protein
MDLRQVAIAGETDRFMRYVDSAIEKACLKVRTLQEKYQNVTQGILMINIDGYNLVEHGCLQCKLSGTKIDENRKSSNIQIRNMNHEIFFNHRYTYNSKRNHILRNPLSRMC